MTFSRSKVFVAVAVEWDETNPDIILEIGIAVLDLRSERFRSKKWPPTTWAIRPRHIIIRENVNVHNGKYVRSNKFGYKFRKSYLASLETAVNTVNRLLSMYHWKELVIVGHHMRNALHRLRDVGIGIDRRATLFDTAGLERAWSRRVNGRRRNLRDICDELEIPYYRADKMNNAGNNAFFVMAVFKEMCCVEED